MKTLVIIVSCLFFMASAIAWDGKVVGISDGDTLNIMRNGKSVRVRLAEVDAPEKSQPFGNQSKKSLADLCFSSVASVDEKTTDRYGRTVGRVTCKNIDVNAEQVRQGMAWAYTQYLTDSTIAALEKDAKSSGRGLWADQNPTPPWEFRHGGKKSQSLVPAKEKIAATKTDSGFECAGKTKCGEMSNCSEAKFYLEQCGVRRLDRDGDGVPCESLCK